MTALRERDRPSRRQSTTPDDADVMWMLMTGAGWKHPLSAAAAAATTTASASSRSINYRC